MSNNNSSHFLFETELNWTGEKRGVLSAKDAEGTIEVATPPAFGGTGKPWTPEHLLLGAVSSCFMTTFLSFADKLKVEVAHLECSVIGQVELVEGKYKFTQIDVYPIVCITDDASHEKAAVVAEKTEKYCLISNSIDAKIFYHTSINQFCA